MTGVELIIGALAAGSAAGIANAASGAIGDAYTAFKALLARRLTGEARALSALEAQEVDPGVWETRLGADLVSSGAAGDERVLAAAKRLLGLLDAAAGVRTEEYRVDLRMAKGVQLGNHNTQTNTFH